MSNSLKAYFVFLSVFLLLVVVLGILQVIPATSLEPSYRYKHRYESFVRLLNEEERKLFFEKKYEEASRLIDERIKADINFSNSIMRIKEYEVIETFPTPMMLEYFGYYVYNEVLKYNPDYRFSE
ncbi:MAG: hypothetical protein N2712_05495 [Brevinematales bacterium]|nr:hypothetical protein [Brevinematales bacterium]